MKNAATLLFSLFIIILAALTSGCDIAEGSSGVLVSDTQINQLADENGSTENASETIHEEAIDVEEFTLGETVYTFDRQQIEDNGIVIQTDRGIYTFLPAEWTIEMLINYIDFMDRCITFAYNWFDIKQDAPIPVELDTLESERIGGFGGAGGVRI